MFFFLCLSFAQASFVLFHANVWLIASSQSLFLSPPSLRQSALRISPNHCSFFLWFFVCIFNFFERFPHKNYHESLKAFACLLCGCLCVVILLYSFRWMTTVTVYPIESFIFSRNFLLLPSWEVRSILFGFSGQRLTNSGETLPD